MIYKIIREIISKIYFAPKTNIKARRELAGYLKGEGIEIGALHNPLIVDKEKAKVKYIDFADYDQLKEVYPEIDQDTIVKPDMVMPADDLFDIKDNSLDFVIANHLIEHLQNPIKALLEWHRVLKKGGLIYLSVPDMRAAHDKHRESLTIEHAANDYKDGGISSIDQHLRDWAIYSFFLKDPIQIEHCISHLKSTNYPIHFHCFKMKNMEEILKYLNNEFQTTFSIKKAINTKFRTNEFLMLIEK